jgi:hypothetical protein
MRLAGNIVGIIALLIGLLWILQGSNVIGGSVMSGESQWLYIGVAVALGGAVIVWWANRRRN